jgi:hypothetical protein
LETADTRDQRSQWPGETRNVRMSLDTSLGVNQNSPAPSCDYGIADAHSLPLPHLIAAIRWNELLLFIVKADWSLICWDASTVIALWKSRKAILPS